MDGVQGLPRPPKRMSIVVKQIEPTWNLEQDKTDLSKDSLEVVTMNAEGAGPRASVSHWLLPCSRAVAKRPVWVTQETV